MSSYGTGSNFQRSVNRGSSPGKQVFNSKKRTKAVRQEELNQQNLEQVSPFNQREMYEQKTNDYVQNLMIN